MKIKNLNYRNFLDKGIIEFVTLDQLKLALENIKGKFTKEKRAVLIALYYTGARPNEVLELKGKDVTKEKSFIKVKCSASKGGLPRTLFLPSRFALVNELYTYASSVYPDMYLFFMFKKIYRRSVTLKNGTVKVRIEKDALLRYYVQKWFKGIIEDSITPYFLRHSRFSQLSEAGVSIEDIRFMKGSRSIESVMPYLHLSTSKAKKISKKIK